MHIDLKDVEISKDKKSENYKVNFSNSIKETIPFDEKSLKLKNQTSSNYSVSYCEIEKRSKDNEDRKT